MSFMGFLKEIFSFHGYEINEEDNSISDNQRGKTKLGNYDSEDELLWMIDEHNKENSFGHSFYDEDESDNKDSHPFFGYSHAEEEREEHSMFDSFCSSDDYDENNDF